MTSSRGEQIIKPWAGSETVRVNDQTVAHVPVESEEDVERTKRPLEEHAEDIPVTILVQGGPPERKTREPDAWLRYRAGLSPEKRFGPYSGSIPHHTVDGTVLRVSYTKSADGPANRVQNPALPLDPTGRGRIPVGIEYPTGQVAWANPAGFVDGTEVPGQERPSWDDWALGLCEAVATRADCSRRQVGAVILDPEHRVIATGYNGYPAGRPGCASEGACPRGKRSYAEVPASSSYTAAESRCDALHAEENAILYARRDLRGCALYVNHAPCPNCTRLIAGTGITFVKWRGESGIEKMYFPEAPPNNHY